MPFGTERYIERGGRPVIVTGTVRTQSWTTEEGEKRTRMYVRVEAFGINVPRMITLTYGFGVGLAALGGVLAAPIYQVSPQMGSNLIIVVFAVVVIGGLGSIAGAILSGIALGVLEGLTKVFWPEASSTVVFVIMALVLLVRPALWVARLGQQTG